MEITPELIQRYQQYPIAFCKEVIHFEPTAQQEQIMRAMAAKPKAWVSVKTGHLTGTTAAIACLALWYVSVFDDVAIPIVSTNLEQLRCSTWKEINKWHAGMQEPFKSAIDIQADDLRAVIKNHPYSLIQARVAKEECPDALQGWCRKNLLFIVDRASEIPDIIFQVAMGAISTDNVKFLIISKPTRARGYFHDTFSSDEWNNITLSSKDSPFMSKEFITQMKDAFSKNFYSVRVLGEFPVEKKRYTVTVDVLQAHGTQTFEVIAESEDDAIDKISHMTDETIQFVGDDIDIQATGKLYVTGCEND